MTQRTLLTAFSQAIISIAKSCQGISITKSCQGASDREAVRLGKLPDSYCNSMECFRRVGSHNPLSFLNCRTPSTGTT